MKTVVVYGQSDTTVATISAILQLDERLSVAVPINDGQRQFDDLSALGELGYNSLRKATAKVVAEADLLVFTDATNAGDDDADAGTLVQANIDQLRSVLNTAMAAGFAGSLLVVTTRDDLLTYFAQRFSGVPQNRVLGLGTVPHSIFLANLIGERLGVPAQNVAIDVVGTANYYQVLWSRAAISTVPLLSLIQNDEVDVNATLLQDSERELAHFAATFSASVIASVTGKLVATLVGAERDIVPVTLVNLQDDVPVVSARPAIIGSGTAEVLPRVAGAQTEETAWQAIDDRLRTEIKAIETNGSTE